EMCAAAVHDLERGGNETAEMGAIIVDRIVRAHLQTMARLNIGYDLLTYEGDIVRLKFWAHTFEILKAQGAVFLQTEGKLAGCWVMRIDDERSAKASAERSDVPGERSATPDEGSATPGGRSATSDEGSATPGERSATPDERSAMALAEREEESREKVIVRSNGVVTYVGKDIANQFWKFGLLGRDFYYRPRPDWQLDAGHPLWATTSTTPADGEHTHPAFGGATHIYNVIDSRQMYLQALLKIG